MEPNLPVIAKKFWHVVREACSILRKRISKAKLLADFKIYMMMKRGKIGGKAAVFNLVFHHHHHHHQPPQSFDGELLAAAGMEMVNSAAASPALLEIRRTSPSKVRQLKITDSPLPLPDVEEDSHVDEAAEEFIMKFYEDLRHQNSNT